MTNDDFLAFLYKADKTFYRLLDQLHNLSSEVVSWHKELSRWINGFRSWRATKWLLEEVQTTLDWLEHFDKWIAFFINEYTKPADIARNWPEYKHDKQKLINYLSEWLDYSEITQEYIDLVYEYISNEQTSLEIGNDSHVWRVNQITTDIQVVEDKWNRL